MLPHHENQHGRVALATTALLSDTLPLYIIAFKLEKKKKKLFVTNSSAVVAF